VFGLETYNLHGEMMFRFEDEDCYVPCYETDAGFMAVVHEMMARGFGFTMECAKNDYSVACGNGDKMTFGDAATIGVAVCRAALLCCGEVGE